MSLGIVAGTRNKSLLVEEYWVTIFIGKTHLKDSREDPPVALELVSKQLWCPQCHLSSLIFSLTQLEGIKEGKFSSESQLPLFLNCEVLCFIQDLFRGCFLFPLPLLYFPYLSVSSSLTLWPHSLRDQTISWDSLSHRFDSFGIGLFVLAFTLILPGTLEPNCPIETLSFTLWPGFFRKRLFY